MPCLFLPISFTVPRPTNHYIQSYPEFYFSCHWKVGFVYHALFWMPFHQILMGNIVNVLTAFFNDMTFWNLEKSNGAQNGQINLFEFFTSLNTGQLILSCASWQSFLSTEIYLFINFLFPVLHIRFFLIFITPSYFPTLNPSILLFCIFSRNLVPSWATY